MQISTLINEYLPQKNVLGLIRVLVHPATILISTPIRLVQTLWHSRILLNGDWANYPHFSGEKSLLTMFYWVVAINLHRFGISGRSPYIGLGNFKLSFFFYQTFFSLYFFWVGGCIFILCCMFGWWGMNFLWLQHTDRWQLAGVLLLLLFSSSFYCFTFSIQNYNVLGWLFVPLFLYALYTGNWLMVTIALLLVSFGSITATVDSVIITGIYALYAMDYMPLICLIPVAGKMASHVLLEKSLLKSLKSLLQSLKSLLKLIGAVKKEVKYQRKKKTTKQFVVSCYYFFLYLQINVAYLLIYKQIDIILLAAFCVYFIDAFLIRFSDFQSNHIMMVSTATCAILFEFNVYILPFYWILISPLPITMGFNSYKNIFEIVPVLKPYYLKPLMDEMMAFIKPVLKDQRVLMTFNDPEGVHGNVFGTLNFPKELLSYAMNYKEAHFMPDWFAVAEDNDLTAGIPNFWGKELDSVVTNIRNWKADFVVLSLPYKATLEEEWTQNGFQLLTRFSWFNHPDLLESFKDLDEQEADWLLLQVPQQ